jgi:hypothetical protein
VCLFSFDAFDRSNTRVRCCCSTSRFELTTYRHDDVAVRREQFRQKSQLFVAREEKLVLLRQRNCFVVVVVVVVVLFCFVFHVIEGNH